LRVFGFSVLSAAEEFLLKNRRFSQARSVKPRFRSAVRAKTIVFRKLDKASLMIACAQSWTFRVIATVDNYRTAVKTKLI
jgi:hypothetical protein